MAGAAEDLGFVSLGLGDFGCRDGKAGGVWERSLTIQTCWTVGLPGCGGSQLGGSRSCFPCSEVRSRAGGLKSMLLIF